MVRREWSVGLHHPQCLFRHNSKIVRVHHYHRVAVDNEMCTCTCVEERREARHREAKRTIQEYARDTKSSWYYLSLRRERALCRPTVSRLLLTIEAHS
jgi:hypothetical protein